MNRFYVIVLSTPLWIDGERVSVIGPFTSRDVANAYCREELVLFAYTGAANVELVWYQGE